MTRLFMFLLGFVVAGCSADPDYVPSFDFDVGTQPKSDTDLEPAADQGVATYTPCGTVPYNEPVVVDANLDDLVAAWDPADYRSFMLEALDRRAPFSWWIVDKVDAEQDFDCVEEYAAQYASDGPTEMLLASTTVVHECAHALNMAEYFDTHSYYVGDGRKFVVPIVPGPERRIAKQYVPWDDNYTDLYLGVAGEQMFDMLVEELNGYVQGLVAAVAFADFSDPVLGRSHRDGVVALQLFTAAYLFHVRTNTPATYDAIANDSTWRELLVTLWDRANFVLELARPSGGLGIRDEEILVERLKYDVEIETLRALHCTP